MTAVRIKRSGNKIVSVECDGHTDYGMSGEDIVCAALSSVVQTAALGLLSVAGIPLEYKTDPKRGYLYLALPDGMTDGERHDADILLETMYLGVCDLATEYGKFIKTEEIK
jgi:uncharacterized protein YsxB (DUF464 family)